MAGRNTVEIIIAARDQASRAMRAAFGGIQSTSKVAMGAVAGATIAAGTALATLSGLITKSGIAYNSMAENSQVAWNTLLGSQEKAKKMLGDIANFAKSTQFDTTSVDMMAKYMFNAGYSGKQLFDQLTKIADVSGAFNIPADSAQELARQMSQVVQAGTAYTEDLNILQDRGVPIYKAISEQLGITVGDVKNMASKGKLSADIYMKAFDSISKSVKGSSEAQSKTFTGMISTLQDNLNMISGELTKGLFEKLKGALNMVMPILDNFLSGLRSGGLQGALAAIFPESIANVISNIAKGIGVAKQAIMGLFNLFSGNSITGITILTQLGLSPEMITFIVSAVNTVKSTMSTLFSNIVNGWSQIFSWASNAWGSIKSLFSGNNALGQSFGKIFETAKSIIMPILTDIVAFIKDKIAMIKQFWDENGAQILQAVKNAWAVIAAVFQFIAPVILFIVKMLWENVKGVIDGALKIIMGIIKVFAGLFTGDFSKMWEGIKQLFIGALQFVWNLVNLLLVGKLLGSIKSFITQGVSHFTGFWTKAVEIFKNLDTYLFNIVKGMVSKVVGFFRNLYTQGAQIFGTLRTFGANTFSAMWTAIKTVASNIASGVKNYFSSMFTGAKFHMDNLLSKAKSIFSAVKNAITNPIDTAKSLVGKAISAIKNMFSNISVKIPLPHFSVKMGKKNILGKEVPWPDLDVNWYDKGGVFYGPQIIGVGEKRPEVVGALSDIKAYVKEAVNEVLPQTTKTTTVPQYAIINIDGRQAMLAMIDYIDEEQALRAKRWG